MCDLLIRICHLHFYGELSCRTGSLEKLLVTVLYFPPWHKLRELKPTFKKDLPLYQSSYFLFVIQTIFKERWENVSIPNLYAHAINNVQVSCFSKADSNSHFNQNWFWNVFLGLHVTKELLTMWALRLLHGSSTLSKLQTWITTGNYFLLSSDALNFIKV